MSAVSKLLGLLESECVPNSGVYSVHLFSGQVAIKCKPFPTLDLTAASTEFDIEGSAALALEDLRATCAAARQRAGDILDYLDGVAE